MPVYTTQHIKNLSTGKPFTFEISDDEAVRLERWKSLIASGKALTVRSTKEIILAKEFSFFPAYKDIFKIWINNGFTMELITRILKDFGVTDDFAEKLLSDAKFIEDVRPWFAGITHDGSRVSRVLQVVYDTVICHFSPTQRSDWEFHTMM